MESGKKLEANDLDIENRQKLQLLEMYERAFDGPEQQLTWVYTYTQTLIQICLLKYT
ncbi:hypothetical protein Q3C81_09455 [Enterococcus faecium]|nr:hypothetical protein [Enterococcus faecium]